MPRSMAEDAAMGLSGLWALGPWTNPFIVAGGASVSTQRHG